MFELAMATMGWMFFATYGVLALVVFLAVAHERNIFATCALIFGAGVMYLCGGAPDTSWIQAHPFLTAGIVLGYIVAGVLWSFVKWYFFLLDCKAKGLKRPYAEDNKSRIVSWMMYWPVSVIATCIFDFIKRAWNSLYEKISGVFDSITDKVYPTTDGE